MKSVTIEIPDDCDIVFEDGDVKLVKTIDLEKEAVLCGIEADIETIHEKYKDIMKGKFGIKVEFRFTPYRSGNRKKVNHWVDKSCSIEVIGGEQSWHD